MSEKTQKVTFQRKTIFVKKGLQLRYIATILLSALFAFAITIHEVIWAAEQIAVKNPAVKDIVKELNVLVPMFAFKACLFIGILLIFAIVVSHQQAGPLYKFEKSFGKLKDGDLTYRVYLRKGDQLTEMQKEFNDMVYSLQRVVAEYEDFRSYAEGSSDERVRARAVETGEHVKGIMPEMKV
jgi:methyl-accepting chemotaxis protein